MDKKITEVKIKRNNGGGISYEAYNKDDEIIAVVTGVEYQDPQPDYAQEARELIAGDWSIYDASQWYDRETNSMGDTIDVVDDDGDIIAQRDVTAADVIDDHESTDVIDIVEAGN